MTKAGDFHPTRTRVDVGSTPPAKTRLSMFNECCILSLCVPYFGLLAPGRGAWCDGTGQSAWLACAVCAFTADALLCLCDSQKHRRENA
jgi:hypothetical protein